MCWCAEHRSLVDEGSVHLPSLRFTPKSPPEPSIAHRFAIQKLDHGKQFQSFSVVSCTANNRFISTKCLFSAFLCRPRFFLLSPSSLSILGDTENLEICFLFPFYCVFCAMMSHVVRCLMCWPAIRATINHPPPCTTTLIERSDFQFIYGGYQ
jgi:hypothetical protein